MSSLPLDIGYPRALYDPNYVPPELLHRDKTLKSLSSLFGSSLNPEDPFCINVYLYGIPGVGKTVLAKYFVEKLKTGHDEKFTSIYLDLGIKSPIENLRLLVEIYSQFISGEFTYFEDTRKLWSYFHYLRRKTDTPLILILDNVDYLNQRLYEKIIRYSNALNLSTITASKIPYSRHKGSFKKIAEQLDPFKLEIYSSSALLDIISQRISLAFPVKLDRTISKYIIDIVANFDLTRPSTCINILKTIYQHLINGADIDAPFIRDTSYHLLEFPFQDDLDCLLEFDDSPIEFLIIPLLQKLANFFQNRQNVYISMGELFNLYKITCDELYLPYNEKLFVNYTDQLVFNGFLYPSEFQSARGEKTFFMIIDPNRLLDYLNIKFSRKFI